LTVNKKATSVDAPTEMQTSHMMQGYIHLGDIMATPIMPTQVASSYGIYVIIYLFLGEKKEDPAL
jgi:hypothetical protein